MNHTLLFLIMIAAGMRAASAQDTVWLKAPSGNMGYEVRYKDGADTQKVKILAYSPAGELMRERNYYPYKPKSVLNGAYKDYNLGRLKDERFYIDNQLHGSHKVYNENGSLRRNDNYENGTFTSGKCYDTNGADTAWFEHETPARFPGGIDSLRKFIAQRLRYPQKAIRSGIEGTVQVSFIIDKDGSVTDVDVLKSVDPDLDSEAKRIVSRMPRWLPAQQDGKLVKFRFILPVAFRLGS